MGYGMLCRFNAHTLDGDDAIVSIVIEIFDGHRDGSSSRFPGCNRKSTGVVGLDISKCGYDVSARRFRCYGKGISLVARYVCALRRGDDKHRGYGMLSRPLQVV